MREISRYRREIFGKQKYKNRQHYIPVQTTYGNGMVSRSSYDAVRHRLVWRELQNTYHASLQETQYEYDGVGNIVRTRQYASVRGGLGGEYAVVYGYDEQNRLLNARQYNSEIGDYDYFMSYSPSGLVETKVSPELNADMVFGYRYDGGYISHQPKIISSVSDDEDVTLTGWNADGQMTSMVQPNQDRFRKHMWDEAGQLAVAIGNEYCGYYGYNANGERAYKLTGTVLADQYDAGDVNIETYFDDIVLYVNPYMIVTPRGYTKHYYNGSQRIAASLGDYWYNTSTMGVAPEKVDLAREVLDDRLNSGNTDEEYFEEEYYYSEEVGDIRCEPYTLRTTYSSCTYAEDMLYNVFDGGTCMSDEMRGIDKGIFFYHSDHLGSATWITSDRGLAVQYLHYMPFGELWENQQAPEYDERFKFTGKERDAETGYDYFGARYYFSLLGIWMSPDPLLNEYPHISSYAYVENNPIKYIDPNGKEKYNFLNPNGKDYNLFWASENYVDNIPSIHIWAHGSNQSIKLYDFDTGQETLATDALMVVDFLNEKVFSNSNAWKKHTQEGTQAVIVLHACETGQGDNSIAQSISELLPNTMVIAPNENVAVSTKGENSKEIGSYKTKQDSSGKTVSNGVGAWRMFRNGKEIGSFAGTSAPNIKCPEKTHIEGIE